MTQWTLKQGLEKKFAAGHPWVFSSDLAHSPKGVEPGEAIELRDAAGRFLASGYGHPNTLISFRVLSRSEAVRPDAAFFTARLHQAAHLRHRAGVLDFSHRLVFAEADSLPGLIIDRYRLDTAAYGGPAQAFVLQASTAGMDRALGAVLEALEALVAAENDSPGWARTAVVIANDSKSRLLENLAAEPKRVHKSLTGLDLAAARILIEPPLPGLPPTVFTVDLVGGQKTGFFLDQRVNVRAVAQTLAAELAQKPRSLRVLDLCCYVGQWGTQLSHLGRSFGVPVSVTLVDASQKALDLAVANALAQGASAQGLKLDILQDLGSVANGAFDIVICDPPAFIKKKKDLPQGQTAYLKLNREAMKKVAHGGLFFSSSCSGLLGEEEFRGVLARASASHTQREPRWIWRGSHSPDHPQLPQFPQGTYLKSWLAVFFN